MPSVELAYIVRPARRPDLLGVVRLIERNPALDDDGISDRHRATWDRMMATTDLTVYIAEAGAEVVGTGSLLVMPNLGYDCCPTAFVEAMVVAGDQRRRGAGRLILDRMLDDARAAGCQKVQLLSHKRHAEDGAHAFYRSAGFETEAEGFRIYLRPG